MKNIARQGCLLWKAFIDIIASNGVQSNYVVYLQLSRRTGCNLLSHLCVPEQQRITKVANGKFPYERVACPPKNRGLIQTASINLLE